MQLSPLVALGALFVGASLGSAQLTIHVDHAATGAATGASWADAFPDLHAALGAAAPGDQVWVAAGTYVTSTTDSTVSFTLPDGVAVFGGFSGTETALAQRDWEANTTLLSGDVAGDDLIGPGGWLPASPNAGHVVDASGVSTATVIDGFTISFGNLGPIGTVAGDPLMFGSGIYAYGGSPTVRNCTLQYNQAAFANGGGMYVWDGSPEVSNCRFLDNYVHLGSGGGLYVGGASLPVVRDCTFARNTTIAGTGDATGGGFANSSSLAITVERCRFEDNTCRPFYSISDYVGYGGGLHNFSAPITVRDCVFTGNEAQFGAGFMTWDSATVVNCLFHANEPTPWESSVGGYGGDGTVMINDFGAGVLTLVNSTVVDNQGSKYPGVLTAWNASATLENCIVWGNLATNPETAGGWKEQVAGDFDAAYSCIATIFAPHAPGEDPIKPEDLPGCIDSAPQFVDAAAADYTLAAGSPCIDAGDNSALPAGVTLDLGGLPRLADDPLTTDTGLGTAPLVDLGAHEFHALPSASVSAYGCTAPAGSLTVLSGAPQLGGVVVLGIDNPLATQSAGALPFLALATAADPGFPCGTLLPGLGMAGAGAPGELLVGLLAPNPFEVLAGPPWAGAGAPASLALAIPSDVGYAGLTVYAQGALVDAAPGASLPVALTAGLVLVLGL